MASKRTFDDVSQDDAAQDAATQGTDDQRIRRPRVDRPLIVRPRGVRPPNPIFRGDARFFPSIQELDGDIFRARYPVSLLYTEMVCSNNIDRPLLTAPDLDIPLDCKLVGVVYNPCDTTRADLVREHNIRDVGVVRVADAQFSVTGSVGVSEMAPFAQVVASVQANVAFHTDAMRIVHDACGEQQAAFNQMLQTVAMRETFEETGFFSPPEFFRFVRFERNWAIFKVHASRLRARTLEGCRAFVAQNPQEPAFRAGFVPFKVQVYVYGTRDELQQLIGTVRVRPAVERDIAGLVLYDAREIGQFRVSRT